MNRGMWLGFLFFIALVILGFATLLVKNWNPFGHPLHLTIHFERAQGLRPGSDVRVDGMTFGRVEEVSLHPTSSGVRVLVQLTGPVTLYQDAEILVESSSVLGGNIVSIRRGSKPPALILTEELAGKSRGGLEEVGDLATDNRENLKQLIQNLKDLSQALKDGQGTVGKLLKSDELHKEAVDTLKSAREAVTDARAEIKRVGDTLNDNIKQLTGKITEKLDKAEGPAGALLNDKKLTEKLDRIVANVEETSKNLKDITDSVKKGDGALGKMVTDKEMGDKLKATIDNVERASESIKNIGTKLETGEGSVGRLLQDDELYESARRTLDDVDHFFARASRAVVEFTANYQDYPTSKETISHLGIRIGPDEDKYFLAGVALMSLDKTGPIQFKQAINDDQNATIYKVDIMAAYRAPWLLDRHLVVRGGFLEGMPGGAVDFRWEDWGFFSYPATFTFEARNAYHSVDRLGINEEINGAMMRAYAQLPLWVRRDTWLETLLSYGQIYVGVNRLTKNQEFLAGVSVSWADEDFRTLIGLIGAAK
ncbi:MAG TPA: MlaD family protein [Planctomycetota bacterium]|nr:MlaD family protein [Planctomycetota bacterium]